MKPGWKSTEFWVSIATALTGLATTLGYMTSEQVSPTIRAIESISGGLITLGAVFGYAISRGLAKIKG